MPEPVGPPARVGGPRPGYGIRRRDLVELLATLTAASTEREVWGNGTVLDVSAYPTSVPVPSDLVSSVRCLVWVDDHVVVCQTPHGPHILPGGRRQAGETYEATACREVHEETGWLVDEADLRLLGFAHHYHVFPQPDDYPYLHPDFLQLVYTAPARGRDDAQGANWVDVEGWEQGFELHTRVELERLPLTGSERVFLRCCDAENPLHG